MFCLCRHELSLYAHISKINWQFDKGRIAGAVSDPASGDIRQFDIPPDTPAFAVTNRLWKLIG